MEETITCDGPATIYRSGGFGIQKLEVKRVTIAFKPHAQYERAAFVTVRLPRKRSDETFVVYGSEPWLLVLAGKGHPEPTDCMELQDDGSAVTRYASFDPRWRSDFEAQIAPYLAELAPEMTIADFRRGLPARQADPERVITYTTAPEAYDWFGTFTVETAGSTKDGKIVRKVSSDPGHADGQRGRYSSGLHMAVDETEWKKLVAYGLAFDGATALVKLGELPIGSRFRGNDGRVWLVEGRHETNKLAVRVRDESGAASDWFPGHAAVLPLPKSA